MKFGKLLSEINSRTIWHASCVFVRYISRWKTVKGIAHRNLLIELVTICTEQTCSRCRFISRPCSWFARSPECFSRNSVARLLEIASQTRDMFCVLIRKHSASDASSGSTRRISRVCGKTHGEANSPSLVNVFSKLLLENIALVI